MDGSRSLTPSLSVRDPSESAHHQAHSRASMFGHHSLLPGAASPDEVQHCTRHKTTLTRSGKSPETSINNHFEISKCNLYNEWHKHN